MSKKKSKVEKAAQAHLDALEGLAQAESILERREALEEAVRSFEAFVEALPNRRRP